MRTTMDIPDPVYRDLKSEAAREGTLGEGDSSCCA